MPLRYVAYNREGQRVRGLVEVETEAAAEQALYDHGLTIVSLKRVGKPFALHEQLPSIFGVRNQDVIGFADQLAILIEAGINLYAAVQIIRDQTEKASFRAVLSKIHEDIARGHTLAEACALHPLVFSSLFLRLLKVGEESGRLDVMLRRVVQYMTKQSEAGSKVRAALTYPIIVLSTAGIAMYIMFTVALPNLLGLFTEFKAELPLVTRVVVAGVRIAGTYGPHLGLLALAAVIGLITYTRTRVGARRLDYFMIGTPVVGSLIVKLSLARLADTMATLIASGIAMTDTLSLLVDITRNSALREPLEDVRTRALTGSSFAEAMGLHAIFPPMLVNLTRIGEETGTLESTFRTLGRVYNDEADRSVSGLIGLLEPALTIVVGGAIGLVSITIISTIYSILPQIK